MNFPNIPHIEVGYFPVSKHLCPGKTARSPGLKVSLLQSYRGRSGHQGTRNKGFGGQEKLPSVLWRPTEGRHFHKNGSFVIEQRQQNPYDIPLNPDWLIGILIMAYYNPHITG